MRWQTRVLKILRWTMLKRFKRRLNQPLIPRATSSLKRRLKSKPLEKLREHAKQLRKKLKDRKSFKRRLAGKRCAEKFIILA